MNYQVSARKWRPQTFEEVVGQDHVTTSLSNAIRLDKLAQAYLFSGIRGVGKTSLARILAKGANCKGEGQQVPCNQCEPCKEITEGRSVDVIEVDGASNTGVDDVRELRENVKYLPLKCRYKIYIIDEVHMLSNAAFNALLKTLEEPPPHLIFIMATTESHKIPATILSRCQHFAFRRMVSPEIVTQLRRVCEARGVQVSERGLGLIARVAEGSMRDALSLIDQAISFGGEQVTDDDLFTLLGRMDGVVFHRLLIAIHKKDAAAALAVAAEIADQGCDLRQFLADWLERLRHLIVAQNIPKSGEWMALPKEELEEIFAEAALFSLEEMQRLFSLFVRLQGEIRTAPQPNLLFDVALMKAILLSDLKPIESVIQRLDVISKSSTNASAGAPAPENHHRDNPFYEKKSPEIGHAFPNTTGRKAPPVSVKRPPALASPLTTAPLQEKKGNEGWDLLLSSIQKERANLGSYLAEGQFKNFDEKELRLSYAGSNTFLIPLIQKTSSREWLEAFFKKKLGHTLSLVLVEEIGQKKSASKPAASPQRGLEPMSRGDAKPSTEFVMRAPSRHAIESSTDAKNKVAPSRHPLVREALRILGGQVIETREIPKDVRSNP